jgi:tRNA(His) 5'-end guanylyltransferase
MAAQARFSPQRLHGVSSGGMQELLFAEAGINWNDYPAGCKRGRVTVRETGERPVEYVDRRTQETVSTTAVRSWWATTAAPAFAATPGGWLAGAIPTMSTLGVAS